MKKVHDDFIIINLQSMAEIISKIFLVWLSLLWLK